MTPRMLLLISAARVLAGAQCVPVSDNRVLAGDMARAVPAFAGMAPEMVLGSAPAPGASRRYGSAELQRLARRYGLPLEAGAEACIVRPAEVLTRERVAAAIGASLPGARIEVVEFSRQPIPRGELRFPVTGLENGFAMRAPWLWRGAISASGQADFPVWAKVHLQISAKRVVAADDLAPGRPVVRTQLREETYQGPPGLPDLSQIVGRVPRRQIRAGAVIERQWLAEPADVVRGQRVRIEIRSGQARLFLDGEAQSSGSRGDVIAVRNPANGKILRPTVADRGSALLEAGPWRVAPAGGGDR